MEAVANYADVIEPEVIRDLFSKEWDALEKALQDSNVTFDDMCAAFENDRDWSELGDDYISERSQEGFLNIENAFDELSVAFESKFPELTLFVGFHDSENECDEVSGGYLVVGGELYQPTPAALRLGMTNVHRKFFVAFL